MDDKTFSYVALVMNKCRRECDEQELHTLDGVVDSFSDYFESSTPHFNKDWFIGLYKDEFTKINIPDGKNRRREAREHLETRTDFSDEWAVPRHCSASLN